MRYPGAARHTSCRIRSRRRLLAPGGRMRSPRRDCGACTASASVKRPVTAGHRSNPNASKPCHRAEDRTSGHTRRGNGERLRPVLDPGRGRSRQRRGYGCGRMPCLLGPTRLGPIGCGSARALRTEALLSRPGADPARDTPQRRENCAAERPAGAASTRDPRRLPARCSKRCESEVDEDFGRDAGDQLIPDPVGLYDTAIERVVNPVASGDELEVGPRTLEARCEMCQLSVRGAVSRRLQERVRIGRSAVPQCVRRVGVAGEEHRSRNNRTRCAA